MTVLTVYNSEGCQGRCDGRCHNATSPRWQCDCICSGRYHGAGLDGTLDRKRRDEGKRIVEQARARAAEMGCTLVADGFDDLFAGLD